MISEQAICETWGEIAAHFTLTTIPTGGAPDTIRRHWVNICVPLRYGAREYQRNNGAYIDKISGELKHDPEGVPVVVADAVFALRSVKKHDAAFYWQQVAKPLGLLIFQAHEGMLLEVERNPDL